MQEAISPIPAQAILTLLLQLAGMLLLARALAEVMRRFGQPAVIGELLAGLLLGPTVLGHFAPGAFELAFPPDAQQRQLLEVISWLGMVLLLLLTGIETDIRAMRNLGRPAVMASLFGMVIPFATGLALGWLLPDAYLTDPDNRTVFALFLATTMAISAMPVIAKILLDLDLISHSIGVVILSSAVVDDTIGWLILSVIAGLAAGGTFSPTELGLTLVWLAVFLSVMRWVAYPLLRSSLQFVNERVDLTGADISLMLGFTFLAAAATEAIGVHAVFGAFVAGMLIRQVPRVQPHSLEVIEVFVVSALSPIFFAFLGIRVDLWSLSGWGLPVVVIGVAVSGKLVGCYVGGRLGRLSHWESIAVGFGMNARGAMGLIVALIGLSLGLLTQEMYSTIVLVAVVTSFMAPLLLRWVMPKLPMSEDERLRAEVGGRRVLVPPGGLRALVPTAGGANAMTAIEFVAPLIRQAGGRLTALYVDEGAPTSRLSGLLSGRGSSLAGTNLAAHFNRAAAVVDGGGDHFTVRQVRAHDVAAAVVEEAGRDYDLLLLGAAHERMLDDPLALEIVRTVPVPVVIVRDRAPDQPWSGDEDGAPRPVPTDGTAMFRRLLVPVDGSVFSRYAAELAFAYAAAAGAKVRILHVISKALLTEGSIPVTDRRDHEARRARIEQAEQQIRQELAPLAAAYQTNFAVRVLSSGTPREIIIGESRSGDYDLLVLGTETKLLGQPFFIGQGTAEIAERAGCTTAIVLPGVRSGR
jgi:Kef-type K+ transport system membrane component KefB/nucleotide-binding universal stress UspA family protein